MSEQNMEDNKKNKMVEVRKDVMIEKIDNIRKVVTHRNVGMDKSMSKMFNDLTDEVNNGRTLVE